MIINKNHLKNENRKYTAQKYTELHTFYLLNLHSKYSTIIIAIIVVYLHNFLCGNIHWKSFHSDENILMIRHIN